MGSETLNERRWERQRHALIETIRERGVNQLEVLRAFDVVPRHLFLPDAVQHRAYEDSALPIGFQQTASQPSLQALYLQILQLQPEDRVLEIGTGSGYLTALLSQLAGHVYSIERIRELSARAREVLDQLRVSNVALLVGDGTVGWSRYAPYQKILVSAAAPAIPNALLDQLAPGGSMLIPLGDRELQKLTLVRKPEAGAEPGSAPGNILTEEVGDCVFVPLLGRFGWPTN